MECKEVVRRLVDEAVNGGDGELVAELFAPKMAAFARDRITAMWGIEDTLDRFDQLGLDPIG